MRWSPRNIFSNSPHILGSWFVLYIWVIRSPKFLACRSSCMYHLMEFINLCLTISPPLICFSIYRPRLLHLCQWRSLSSALVLLITMTRTWYASANAKDRLRSDPVERVKPLALSFVDFCAWMRSRVSCAHSRFVPVQLDRLKRST